jgi:hypothetical protein
VRAKSKKAINDRLAAGELIFAESYSMFGGQSYTLGQDNPPDGTVIKVYDKVVAGSPYAKAYGNWDSKKGRVK